MKKLLFLMIFLLAGQSTRAELPVNDNDKCGSGNKPRVCMEMVKAEDREDDKCGCSGNKPPVRAHEVKGKASSHVAVIKPDGKPPVRAQIVRAEEREDDKCGCSGNKPPVRMETVKAEEREDDKCGCSGSKPPVREVHARPMRLVLLSQEEADMVAENNKAYVYIRNWHELAEFAARMQNHDAMKALLQDIQAGRFLLEKDMVMDALENISVRGDEVDAEREALLVSLVHGDHDITHYSIVIKLKP
jgi:hypothetical protein